MNWQRRITQFVKKEEGKVAFLVDVRRDLGEVSSFLSRLLCGVSPQYLFVYFGLGVPKQLRRAGFDVKTPEDYMSGADYDEIDNYVFGGLSKSWYAYKDATDYRGISLGELFEYDFQRYLIPRIKNLEVTSRVIAREGIRKIVAIDDNGELTKVAALCGGNFNIPALEVPLGSRGAPSRYGSMLKSKMSSPLRAILDSLALRRVKAFKGERALVLIDAKLLGTLERNIEGASFALCPLESGLKIRLEMFRRGLLYLPLNVAGDKGCFRERIFYKDRWRNLSSDEGFRGIFRYKDFSVWEAVCDKLADFFSAGIPRAIRNLNILCEAFGSRKIKGVILRNDVKELERTVIRCARRSGVTSLVIQHGVLAESNGHNFLLADRYAAWGRASVEWYARFGNRPERFTVTGNPRFDRLTRWEPAISKERLCRRLKLDAKKGIILFATQQVNKFSSYWTDDLFWVIADRLLEAMKKFSDKQFIIKADPYESVGPYEEIITASSSKGAVAVKDIDIYSLISSSDVVVTLDSTVALEAAVFDKPLITVNLTGRRDRVPYAEKGAAIGVYDAKDIEAAMAQVLLDPGALKRLAAGRKAFVEEYAYKIDGKAARRISDLIKDCVVN